MIVARQIASSLFAMANCVANANPAMAQMHRERIERLVDLVMPSGAGFDNGTVLDFDKSTPSKLVFATSFHHMHATGVYDGWTAHEVIVTPSLVFDFEMRVSGKNRNDIKDHIGDNFNHCLQRAADSIAGWMEE